MRQHLDTPPSAIRLPPPHPAPLEERRSIWSKATQPPGRGSASQPRAGQPWALPASCFLSIHSSSPGGPPAPPPAGISTLDGRRGGRAGVALGSHSALAANPGSQHLPGRGREPPRGGRTLGAGSPLQGPVLGQKLDNAEDFPAATTPHTLPGTGAAGEEIRSEAPVSSPARLRAGVRLRERWHVGRWAGRREAWCPGISQPSAQPQVQRAGPAPAWGNGPSLKPPSL